MTSAHRITVGEELRTSEDLAAVRTAMAQETARTGVKASNYAAAPGEYIPVDTTSGNVTITLPTAPVDKTRIGVKMVVQGGSNTVSVACGGTDVLNKTSGSTTVTLSLLNQGITAEYQASTHIWTIINADLPLAQLDSRFLKQTDAMNTYAGLLPASSSYTYNADGTIATETVAGVTSTFTYNGDGSINTMTRSGVTRTFGYNTDGTIATVA